MNLKKFLKTLKLNEGNISTLLGGVIILILGVLVINYFKKLPSTNQLPEISNENIQQTYMVEQGDSLSKIAQKLWQVPEWQPIAEANKITNPDEIEVGQQIIIPSRELIVEEVPANETPVPTITPTPTLLPEAASTDSSITGATYEVVKGDNLWNIALRAYGDGYKWVEIARENKLKNPDLIHPGNIFVLPR